MVKLVTVDNFNIKFNIISEDFNLGTILSKKCYQVIM